MKTLKERAEKSLAGWDDNVYFHHSELTEDSYKDGFIIGATEQKSLDMAEAFLWVDKIFKEGIEIDGSWWENEKLKNSLIKTMSKYMV